VNGWMNKRIIEGMRMECQEGRATRYIVEGKIKTNKWDCKTWKKCTSGKKE